MSELDRLNARLERLLSREHDMHDMRMKLYKSVAETRASISALKKAETQQPESASVPEQSAPTADARARDMAAELYNLKNAVDIIFTQITSADNAVRDMCALHPAHADNLNRAFTALRALCDFHVPRIYEAHCYELLNRVVRGESLAEPTDAELFAVLYELLLAGPLSEHSALLFESLFSLFFPDKYADIAPAQRTLADDHATDLLNATRTELSKQVKKWTKGRALRKGEYA